MFWPNTISSGRPFRKSASASRELGDQRVGLFARRIAPVRVGVVMEEIVVHRATTTDRGTCVPPGPSKYATGMPVVHPRERGKVRANRVDRRDVGASASTIVPSCDLHSGPLLDHLHDLHVIGDLAELAARDAKEVGGELRDRRRHAVVARQLRPRCRCPSRAARAGTCAETRASARARE